MCVSSPSPVLSEETVWELKGPRGVILLAILLTCAPSCLIILELQAVLTLNKCRLCAFYVRIDVILTDNKHKVCCGLGARLTYLPNLQYMSNLLEW